MIAMAVVYAQMANVFVPREHTGIPRHSNAKPNQSPNAQKTVIVVVAAFVRTISVFAPTEHIGIQKKDIVKK